MVLSVPIRFRGRKRALAPSVQIIGVSVINLFGRLTYSQITTRLSDESNGRIAVLYGDNGTGKTTILRLIYACLSPETGSGLRDYIARVFFEKFSIYLSNGISLVVEKIDSAGSYTIRIGNSEHAQTFSVVVSPDGKVREQEGTSGIERALRHVGFDILFVDHNRVVQSTYAFLAELPNGETPTQSETGISDYVYASREAAIRASRRLKESDLQFPLPQIVHALERWFRTQAFRQGAAGEQSAAAVYLGIVKLLNRDRRKAGSFPPLQIKDVVKTISLLRSDTESFVRHGLLSEYPFEEFVTIYESASKAKKSQIESVLSPFLDSIQKRISALTEVHRQITVFESELSKYFAKKQVSFHILDGLQIRDEKGVLNLDALSSGEKQLIFLLCSAALSRSRKSLRGCLRRLFPFTAIA